MLISWVIDAMATMCVLMGVALALVARRFPRQRLLGACVGLGTALLILSLPAQAADLPHPMHVPRDVTGSERQSLESWRTALLGEMDDLGKRIDAQQAKCRAVDARNTALVATCRAEIKELQQAHDAYYRALAAYTDRIKAVQARQATPTPPVPSGGEIAAPPPDASFPPQAAQLMAALDRAAALPIYERGPLPNRPPTDPHHLQDTNCQFHFRALGEELAKLGVPSWNHEFPLSEKGGLMADGIFRAIAAEAEAHGRWRELGTAEAQAAANRGSIVIGGVPRNLNLKPHPRTHGHLAVVVPLPPGLDLAQFQEETVRGQPATAGTGPFVRDGNEHVFHRDKPDQRYELSTRGAIPASRMMPAAETRYFLWVPAAAK